MKLQPGDQFNFLTVLSEPCVMEGHSRVAVRCACGTEKVIRTSSLLSTTKSCGCQRAPAMKKLHTRHGMEGSPTYTTWAAMLSRCTNANATGYDRYGGRGITVCPEWHSFENFYADMGERPEGHTLERRKNDQGYNKDNCMWATRKAQARNRRNTIFIEVDGERISLAEAAEKAGLTYACVLQRIQNYGWPVERALTTRSSR